MGLLLKAAKSTVTSRPASPPQCYPNQHLDSKGGQFLEIWKEFVCRLIRIKITQEMSKIDTRLPSLIDDDI